jgi:DNA replication protein DnaC
MSAATAPSLAAAVERLAERARAESWSHEEFLAACLQREVAAREAHELGRIPLLIVDEVGYIRLVY